MEEFATKKSLNIFNYAMKELSLDAVICWLLNWANKDNFAEDESLHELGKKLIGSLLNKHDIKLENIETVEVLRQKNYIDAAAIINDKYFLLIESKVGTKDSKGQLIDNLEKTKILIDSCKQLQSLEIVPIYFKIMDQADWTYIEEIGHDDVRKKYRSFKRQDFLEVLNSYSGDNLILNNYLQYLQSIEDEVDGFASKSLELWNKNQITGFYKTLKSVEALDVAGWGYVPNGGGGHMGLWMSRGAEASPCPIKLQFEFTPFKAKSWCSGRRESDLRLVLKITVLESADGESLSKSRSRLRNIWKRKIDNNPGLSGITEKITRHGNGKTMTVVDVKRSDFLVFKCDEGGDSNGKLDLEATITKIQAVQSMLLGLNDDLIVVQ